MARYEKSEVPGLKGNTWSQRQRAFKSFIDTMGAQTKVADIERSTAAAWGTDLIGDARTKTTAGNMVSHVAQLFEALIAWGEIAQNTVKGVVVVKKKEKDLRRKAGFEWEPFELDALQRIYDPANLVKTRTEHVRWAAMIGLYTGARVGEVAQLFLRDFITEGDIPCLCFRADSDGQTQKTEASERVIPLHPDLIRLGLLERVELLRTEGHERLFPDMRIDSKAGTGNAISKGFGYYLDRLGIQPRRENGIVGFHSLRKTVVQTLQASNLSAERRRAYVGHELGERDVHAVNYMRLWRPKELAELFPGLPWGQWLALDAIKELLKS